MVLNIPVSTNQLRVSFSSSFQWRAPQEEELRVEPRDLKGAKGAAGGGPVQPDVPEGAQGGHGECAEQEHEAAQRQRRLGRQARPPALHERHADQPLVFVVMRSICSTD